MLTREILLGVFLIVFNFNAGFAATEKTLVKQKGETVVFSCPIDFETCGELHSVSWLTGKTRIGGLVVNQNTAAEIDDSYRNRASIQHATGAPHTNLTLKEIQLTDQGTYICVPTFYEPRVECESSSDYRIHLEVAVPPKEILMYTKENKMITNGTKVGKYLVEQMLSVTCEVRNTKPPPSITWYKNGKMESEHSPTINETDGGLVTATLELSKFLSRGDLGSTFECRVESLALSNPIRSYFHLDLNVRPTKINLTGVEHHTVQGTQVTLVCKVFGALPAANITWRNSSVEITPSADPEIEIDTTTEEQDDETITTTSKLHFSATRFDNEQRFRCEADNEVMWAMGDKPLHYDQDLHVLYPPVVMVPATTITVNVSEQVNLECGYESNPATLTSVKWYKNGELINVNDSRLEGGNPENTDLTILSTTREDLGNYSCELTNSIGTTMSPDQIELDVHYVPIVQVLMYPNQTVENEEANVTLYCDIIDSNPPNLMKVRWYANSTLLKELPDCNETSEDLCHIDPSKLLLESVGRGFFYNYSCEGFNAAGYGPRSADKELVVYYEPGPASISHYPLVAIKKKSVTFECSVEDPGYPPQLTYQWLKGGQRVKVFTKQWTVDPVELDIRTNISCIVSNQGGPSVPAVVALDVHAPPKVSKGLNQYTGFLYTTKEASISCQVECYPRCSISWLKAGQKIDPNSDLYYIKEEYRPAEPFSSGDFESVYSELIFNMTAWPNQMFDIDNDNIEYVCLSSNNSAGPGVQTNTNFWVEYPPFDTNVSMTVIDVEEYKVPQRVSCEAKGQPAPNLSWWHKGKNITEEKVLFINAEPFTREDAGDYECIAKNKHGTHSAKIYVNVQYKPKCNITRVEIEEEDTLICTADGNPTEKQFNWLFKSENDSVELERGKIKGNSSYLVLGDDFTIQRTYRCVVENSVGSGSCHIEVAGRLAWYQRWDKTTLIIFIASIVGILLAVIIICLIIICICRRRRRQEKYHTDVSISATQSVLSYQASTPLPALQPSTPEAPKSPPKWPLRPGVLVHVKGDTKQNLRANRLSDVAITSSKIGGTRSNQIVATIEPHPSTSPFVIAAPEVSAKRQVKFGDGAEISIIQTDHNNFGDIEVMPNKNSTGKDKREFVRSLMENDECPPPILPRRTVIASQNSTNVLDLTVNSGKELLPRKKRKIRPSEMASDDDESAIGGHSDRETQAPSSSGGLFERIFGEIFSREKREDDGDSRQWSNNRFLRLFGIKNSAFGIQRLRRSDSNASNPFATEHRVKGIRCSGSVVTYKKTPVLERPALIDNNNSNALLKPSEITPKSESDPAKQIHEKSSTLADPLTEPGEYENLPFHGLQTAPNKFTTTPINFNNPNVVRVAPRPKLISNSQHQLFQNQQQSLKQPYSMIASQTLPISSANNIPNNVVGGCGSGGSIGASNNQINKTLPNTQISYNLNNCFPTSYTEYYNQQQHKQCSVQVGNPHGSNAFSNYPYTVENPSDRGLPVNNPFLANNLKKFNTSGCRPGGHRKKPPESDKKFYSLKSLGHKKGLHFCSIKPSMAITSSSGKCKRHHSFTGGSVSDVVSGAPSQTLPYITAPTHKMNFYEPPLYENLTDSIQIHEIQDHQPEPPLPPSSVSHKKHHQHKHQQKDDYNNLMEAERMSIYRSDSGISNSSYECITPIPAPRQLYGQKTPHSKCKNTPVYMNVAGGAASPSTLPLTYSSDSCPVEHNPNPSCNCNNNNGNSCSSHCNGAISGNPANTSANRDKNHHQYHSGHHQKSSTNRKCKKRTQSSASLMSLERAPITTNPFISANSSSSGCASIGGVSSSSSSSNVRCYQQQQQQQQQNQQVLVPKELFPSSSLSSQLASSMTNYTKPCTNNSKQHPSYNSSTGATNYNSDNSLTSANHHSSSSSKHKSSSGYVIRPMKLPLRKHHSFHFQQSQTVAGSKFKNRPNYKQNGGPLVFKPFLNEKSAFKPISPAGNSNCSSSSRLGSNNNDSSNLSTPRICGTSLKRHMSNVESYDINRYEGNSVSSTKLDVDDFDEENSDDEEIDEIIITQEEDLPSSSSNSTVVGKRLVYADLAPISLPGSGRAQRSRVLNMASNTTSASPVDDFDDLTINSDSEQIRRSNRLKPIPYPSTKDIKAYDDLDNENSPTVLATPIKRSTQYATLKYNEVSI